jgi:hypothetical protein
MIIDQLKTIYLDITIQITFSSNFLTRILPKKLNIENLLQENSKESIPNYCDYKFSTTLYFWFFHLENYISSYFKNYFYFAQPLRGYHFILLWKSRQLCNLIDRSDGKADFKQTRLNIQFKKNLRQENPDKPIASAYSI